ncbi:CHAT domain-containing protein [Microcoleus sp. CAWBG58]|uniref:CHAT domain-containing protein n=1 Tax=Microcoleus sp. CAWBG58 TaxID=2841651 RepID=UPI0025F55973|nr:CHAT domain-containing tetratricopeptide repeat protein [Microcoleus sp. CAWBG58]
MDEQRLAAYLQLIQALLECPNGEEDDILNAHRELVDADFVQIMEAVAENMAAEGNSNAAWLQNLAVQLANYLGNTATPEEYLSFLMEVLQAIVKSDGNRQVIYPLFQRNLDNLNLNLANFMQTYVIETFNKESSEQQLFIAAIIGNFGNLIQEFPLGTRSWNLEISIACYTATLEVYKCEKYPEQWATTQICLGVAYSNRIKGVRAENLERAIAHYIDALEVYKRENYPEQWSMTQNNLAIAYSNRIEGVRATNIEQAIERYKAALKVYKHENYPEQWAKTQNNLATAYSNRIEEVRAANIEQAIARYTAALEVLTRDNYPEQWAETQNNLAVAYSDRIEGVRAANIEQAITRYTDALKVLIRDNYPEQWATTQNNLGLAYSNRIEGVRAANIERAIARYTAALEVRTRDNYPEQWATTQNNLGTAYRDRIEGVKATNIEDAIYCFRLALEISTPVAYSFNCLKTARNLGNTAFSAGFWDIALEGFDQAIQAVEKSRSWATSDDIRQQMIAESIGVYEKAIQAAVNNNQLEKAIEYCDRTRAQRLVDLMHSNDVYASGEIPLEVQKYLREFEAKQREIDAEVEQLRNPSEGNKGLAGVGSSSRSRAHTEAYTEKIKELEGEKQLIWENIRRLDPVLAGQVQVDPMHFAAMQRLIDNSQTAILCFYTTDDDTHVFVIYKDKAPQIHTCHGEGWVSFQQWIDEGWLSPYLKDRKIWQEGMGEFLSQLSRRLKVDELIGNCLEGIQELIVIPHLYLHQIPLAALPVEPPQPRRAGTGAPPLRRGGLKNQDSALGVGEEPPQPPLGKGGLKSEISALTKEQESLLSPPLSKGGPGGVLSDYFLLRYVPSCRILEYCHQRPTIESPKYGIVENATDDLYFTPFECEQIATIVPEPQRLKGSQQATIATYRNLAQNVNVMHSSHHAVSRLDNPLESRLFLGDGSITLGELMTPGWRLPQLSDVFMSCCETNLASTGITDNLLSLGTGFLCAGARSVVSTLWAVDDFATALFSIFYYQYRLEGLSRPEALWRAQVRLRRISGAELKGLYQPQIDALLPKIIGDLKCKLNLVQEELEELESQQDEYEGGTAEYQELEEKLNKKTEEEVEIRKRKERYESLVKNLYNMSNPFDDLSYWAGFICQGLH